MLRLAVLDLDGTLTDTAVLNLKAWRTALADMGFTAKSDLDKLLGQRAIDIATALVGAGPQARKLVRLKTMYYMELLQEGLEPFPCAEELLSWSRNAGMKVAVVTSSNRLAALAVLNVTGLINEVDEVVAGDDVERGKPDPTPVLLASRDLGVKPKEAYGLGDTIHDVKAYKAAGLGLIMALNPVGDAIYVRNLCEALEVVKSNRKE